MCTKFRHLFTFVNVCVPWYIKKKKTHTYTQNTGRNNQSMKQTEDICYSPQAGNIVNSPQLLLIFEKALITQLWIHGGTLCKHCFIYAVLFQHSFRNRWLRKAGTSSVNPPAFTFPVMASRPNELYFNLASLTEKQTNLDLYQFDSTSSHITCNKFFLAVGGLNSGPCTRQTGTLPLELCPPTFLL